MLYLANSLLCRYMRERKRGATNQTQASAGVLVFSSKNQMVTRQPRTTDRLCNMRRFLPEGTPGVHRLTSLLNVLSKEGWVVLKHGAFN